MKKIVTILVLFLSFVLFVAATDVDRESIIDVKWKLKYPEGSVRAIYFKHDNTFWHYSENNFKIDSVMICRWDLSGDRMYLSCGDTTVQALRILFCDGKNLTISNTKESVQYTKQ